MSHYCKVVIIDDEFIMRQGMKHMLEWEKEGFQIVGEASNGQEGLDVIERVQPNIVLADIVMPVLDGIEFSEILHRRFPEIQLIILSSYDKFEYVKSTLLNGAADYILKPTLNPEILLDTLRRTVEKIPGLELQAEQKGSCQSQMERVLSGYQERLDETLYAEYFPHTLYRMLGIDLKKACGNQKENMAHIKEMMHQFFHERETAVSLAVFLEEEILCYIFNFRVKDEKTLLADIESCVDKIAHRYGSAFFVTGKSFSNMQEIKKHYTEEIREMVQKQFYYEHQNLLVTEGRGCEKKEIRFPFAEYAGNLQRRHFREALEMFTRYVSYLLERQTEEYRLKNLTKNLLYNYLMEMEQYDVESEKLKQKYFHALDDVSYVGKFREVFGRITQELEEFLTQKIESDDVKIIEIRRYIKEHYSDPLELADIAEQFNFNYHYLSSYFNRHAKEGFTEYLNKIRIEKACELLERQPDSIAEISSAIGYSDHSYFCRVFKKMTGKTPSSYRRSFKGKEDDE